MNNEHNEATDGNSERYVFKFECSQKWKDLSETDNARIRHCDRCDTKVFAVENDAELLANAAKGNCVYLPPMRTAGVPLMPDEFE